MSSSAGEIGRIAALWRYPVKSMQGEQLGACDVDERGLVGDRAFALYDIETGKVASAKSPRTWPNLLDFSASFGRPVRDRQRLPAVKIELPGGAEIRTDDTAVDEILSEATGRKVRLVSSHPAGTTFEQYVPAIDGADPDGSDFYREFPNDVFRTGSLYDAAPVHLLTTATLDRLGSLYPEGHFDARRFRPNIVVATDGIEPGFTENDWLKRRLAVGEARIRITMPTLRCVMTTRPQRDLPHDLGVLRTVAQHNRLDVLTMGRFPCAGVYALVQRPGTVRVGDAVRLVEEDE